MKDKFPKKFSCIGMSEGQSQSNYNFKIVKNYLGKRRFSLKKKLKGEENLLTKIINVARGGSWT